MKSIRKIIPLFTHRSPLLLALALYLTGGQASYGWSVMSKVISPTAHSVGKNVCFIRCRGFASDMRSSGFIARDGRILLSCAHGSYEELSGEFFPAGNIYFLRAVNQEAAPLLSSMKHNIRFVIGRSFADALNAGFKEGSPQVTSADYRVFGLYATESTCLPLVSHASDYLGKSDILKNIYCYPSSLGGTYDLSGDFYQHHFALSHTNSYVWGGITQWHAIGFVTGRGASGGLSCIYHPTIKKWYAAGIVGAVDDSGDERAITIAGINSTIHRAIGTALGLVDE